MSFVLSCNTVKQTSEVDLLLKDKNNITELQNYLKEHPNSTQKNKIEKEITKLFTKFSPSTPTCKLNTDFSVDIKIDSVPGANSYIIYWADPEYPFFFEQINSLNINGLYLKHLPEQLPLNYSVIAVKGDVKSKSSKACKVVKPK